MDQLCIQLRDIFGKDDVDVDHVMDALNAYKSNEEDWSKYAIFDTHRYTRNLVDEGNGQYNLMILCWGPGMGSSIHDHTDAHCFVKILSGELKETLFEWPTESEENQPMRERQSTVYSRDGVTYMNDSIGLHRIENPSHTDASVSLHLYIPAFSTCRTFDQRTGQTRKVKMTFWSKGGERTNYKKPQSAVIEPTPETVQCALIL